MDYFQAPWLVNEVQKEIIVSENELSNLRYEIASFLSPTTQPSELFDSLAVELLSVLEIVV